MFGFLRRIRRSLLEEGHLRKYLVYAIGEILLVMIGILLALQVNNWNQQRSIHEKQKDYLLIIRSEFVNNVNALERAKKAVAGTLEAQREIIALMDQTSEVEESRLSKLWAQSFSVDVEFEYENGAMTELLSSGGLKDVANDSIRSELASWGGRIQKVRLQEKLLYSYWEKCNDYLESHADFRTVVDELGISKGIGIGTSSRNNSNNPILQSQELENYLVLYLMVGGGLIERYSELQDDFQMLVEMIEDELSMSERG